MVNLDKQVTRWSYHEDKNPSQINTLTTYFDELQAMKVPIAESLMCFLWLCRW